MTRLVRNLVIGTACAAGLALVWRFVRARELADLAARRGQEKAARKEPLGRTAGPATDPFGSVPVAAVPLDAGQVVPAVPVAIVSTAGPVAAAAQGPPSEEVVEATLRRRGLRIRGRHYGLKVVAATVLLTLLVLFGAGFGAFKLMTGGGEGEGDTGVFDDFGAPLDGGTVPTTTLAPGETLPADTAPVDTAAAAGGEAAAEGAAAGGEAAPAMLRPPDGRYTYAGSGFFETKVFGFAARTAPSASVPATVSAASASCWTLEMTQQPDKTDISHYCTPAPGQLTSAGGMQKQKQFGLGVVATVTCSPAQVWVAVGSPPGQQTPANCTVKNSGTISSTMKLTGTNTFVGVETVSVAGAAVSAYHVRQEQNAEGEMSGPIRTDIWFATSNGMVVKSMRQQQLSGFASHTENTTYVLKSTTPG